MRKKLGLVLGLGLTLSFLGGINFSNEIKISKPAEASSTSYWSTVDSKANADTLFTKLHALVDINTPAGDSGYGDLWDRYQITDKVPGKNKIWDMYGGFQFDYNDRAGQYSKEGDCYNREHSIPKSWWGTVKDERYCDIIHLVPTDGKVNGIRSNYAFGEVDNATYTHKLEAQTDGNGNQIQSVGYSKLGSGKAINGNTAPSIVFEPDDQYKGDFARIYYYFATRYGPKNKIPTSGDGTTMFSTNANNYYLTSYGRALLNKWHVQDPVSQKELDRNDGVESTVGNRNPFVDHPEWADKIFGSNYAATHGLNVETPSLSITASSYSMVVDGTITLTANVNNLSGTVQWYVEDSSTDVLTLSATSGNSITVTGVSKGSKKIYAYIGDVYDWVNITVTSSGGGGGGGQTQTGSYSWDLTDDSYESASDNTVIWSADCASMTLEKNTSQTKADNYLGGAFSETRFYKDQKLTISPKSGYEITSVVFNCNATGGFNNVSWTNASCSINNSIVTITPTDGTISFSGVLSNQCKVKLATVGYGGGSSSEDPVLSSIDINESGAKTTFEVGEAFTYLGLVVTANYSNGTSAIVIPTNVSSPNMSTSGNKTVIVSYTENGVTKTNTYQITVNAPVINPTSITAGVGKEFYVGDVIEKKDLHVEDNFGNEITDFTFANDGYQFLYSDGGANGDLSLKTFVNSVSYQALTCSLDVVVKRRERTEISTGEDATDVLTSSDFNATSTQYVDTTGVKETSGAVYSANAAKDTNGYIQMRTNNNNNSGIVSTTSGGSIKSVEITVGKGTNRIDVYGKDTPYSSPSDLYSTDTRGNLVGYVTATGTVTFKTKYAFVGIRSNNNAIYLSSVEITYERSGSDTAKNVANYIMYSDTEGQCVNNFDTAKTYFSELTSDERYTFMTSDDYVISCARERLLAWATHLGKSINIVDGDYVISDSIHRQNIGSEIDSNEESIALIFIIVSCASVGSALYIFKKKRSVRK